MSLKKLLCRLVDVNKTLSSMKPRPFIGKLVINTNYDPTIDYRVQLKEQINKYTQIEPDVV